jgi:hypothetical protein
MGGQQSTDLDLSLIHNRSDRSSNSGNNAKNSRPTSGDRAYSGPEETDLEVNISSRFRRHKFRISSDGIVDLANFHFEETLSVPGYTFYSADDGDQRLSSRSCPASIDTSKNISLDPMNTGLYF